MRLIYHVRHAYKVVKYALMLKLVSNAKTGTSSMEILVVLALPNLQDAQYVIVQIVQSVYKQIIGNYTRESVLARLNSYKFKINVISALYIA
jgi:hypothetical protein